jgi:membrane protein DedA with SNARE-associated domain
MVLASLISLQTLEQVLNILGYPAVTIFIMIESSGIPFPGETMLLLASFYAAIGNQLQIAIIIPCAALGAILGDNLGYLIGRTGGRALVLRYGRFIFIKPEHLEKAEAFFTKHGDKTVFFGRFFSILRAWSAFLAGINHMRWRTFLIYNAAGGIVWAIFYGLLGYFAGRIFHDNFSEIESLANTLGLVGVAIIAIVFLAIIGFLYARHRSTKALKKQTVTNADANE